MVHIGKFQFETIIALAPMAGVSDLPYRQICSNFGANLTPSEMLSCQLDLYKSRKSLQRLDYSAAPRPIVVQLAGADPAALANAAAYNAARGADIIDINMGCPAKKVCKTAAGSALLQEPKLVKTILEKVVAAVDIPVTLKTRTGLDAKHNNSLLIGKIAEDAGISLLSLHGRSRAQKFMGAAEYDSIANLVANLHIPVVANGDIDSGKRALAVLNYTKAAGVMIGRAACGNPWIFAEISAACNKLPISPKPSRAAVYQLLIAHISSLHQFYGEYLGVRIARKHALWYLQTFAEFCAHKAQFLAITQSRQQLAALENLLHYKNITIN